jgi:hypothetical protein
MHRPTSDTVRTFVICLLVVVFTVFLIAILIYNDLFLQG